MIRFSALSHIFLVALTMMGRICKKLLKYTNVSREVYCPHVRRSKTLLDSGFNGMDSRFEVLDFGFQSPGFQVPHENFPQCGIQITLHGLKCIFQG